MNNVWLDRWDCPSALFFCVDENNGHSVMFKHTYNVKVERQRFAEKTGKIQPRKTRHLQKSEYTPSTKHVTYWGHQ